MTELMRRRMMLAAAECGEPQPTWISPNVAASTNALSRNTYQFPLGVSLGDWSRIEIDVMFLQKPYYAGFISTLDTTSPKVIFDAPGEVSIKLSIDSASEFVGKRGLSLNVRHNLSMRRETKPTGGDHALYLYHNCDANRVMNGRFYRFAIFQNDVKTFEAVPAFGPNKVLCLRDTVSGAYIYQSGTGTFLYGFD